MKKLFTTEQEQFILNNYMNMKYSEIAHMFDDQFTERQVRGWINNNATNKLKKINDSYFDNIDSPIKAYFLGFIYADGWIIDNKESRNYEFGMKLQSSDAYILELLRSELNSEHKIAIIPESEKVINGVNTISHEAALLRIYSKNLINGLKNNGIVQNKTHSNIHPIVDLYFFDYLRGYIDGDGCYYINKGLLNIHITCSNTSNLEYIKTELARYDIFCNIYTEKENKHRLYITRQESVLKLLGLLFYKDCVCLQRKREKVDDYLGSL